MGGERGYRRGCVDQNNQHYKYRWYVGRLRHRGVDLHMLMFIPGLPRAGASLAPERAALVRVTHTRGSL